MATFTRLRPTLILVQASALVTVQGIWLRFHHPLPHRYGCDCKLQDVMYSQAGHSEDMLHKVDHRGYAFKLVIGSKH